MDDAVFVDGQIALHRQTVVVLGHEVFKELAVLDGAAYVQVHQIHVVHGGGVDLTVEAEGFRQVRDLERAGDAVLPAHVGADDVGGALGDDLRHAPMAAACGLGGGDGDIQRAAELGVLPELKVAEGLLKPAVVELLQLAADTDGVVERVVAHGVGHEDEVRADRVAHCLVHLHVEADRSAGVGLVGFDAAGLVVQGLVHIGLHIGIEVGACVDGQTVAVSANIFIERQASFLGADVPQGHIHGAGEEDGEERLMPVHDPELLKDGLAVMGVAAENDRADALLKVRLAQRAAAGGHAGGYAFNAGVGGELDDQHVPAHLGAALALFVKQAVPALDPPGFKFCNNHIMYSFLRMTRKMCRKNVSHLL